MDRRTLLAGVTAVASCSPSLGFFDAVAPRDGGVRRVARDVPYGAHPRQKIDVYAPRRPNAPALPVLVFLYGGGWRDGDRRDYNFLGAALAAQGFVAAIPDYRLVPEVRFPTFVEDCAAALRWIQNNAAAYGGDPNRIVLIGHSAGAYNAIMLALDAHFARDAGCAPGIVKGAVGLAGPYDFYPFDVDMTQNAFGHAPEPQITQPVHFARADAPPLLLLWGEDDDTVGRRNIEGLDRAMREAGGPVETRIYPEIDHIEIMLAIARPFRGRAPVLQDVIGFARRAAP